MARHDLGRTEESDAALADIQGYDSVLVYSDTGYADPAALGDVLADYVDAGGPAVVIPPYVPVPSLGALGLMLMALSLLLVGSRRLYGQS